MLTLIFHTILVNPILNSLVGLYKITGSLGISIILLTLIIRTILIPATAPSMKTMKKQQELQPELNKLKEKYKHDKKKQAEMQMELFKKHGLNPASGCLTQIVMIIVLIALYNVIRTFTAGTSIADIDKIVYFGFLKLAGTVSQIDTQFL